MRVFGLVILILGILFEILLVLAQLGGGRIPSTAFGVAAMMILGGWSMRKHWKPIAQPGQSVAPLPQPVAPPPQSRVSDNFAAAAQAPPAGSPTVELPITPAISAVIAGQLARARRIMAIISLSGGGGFFLLGLVFRVRMAMVAGLALVLIIGGIAMFFGTRPLLNDQRDSTYLRTSGPIQLVSSRFGYILRLWDRVFQVNLPVVKALRGVNWATVDHTKHAHLVLEVRDRVGRSLYSLISSATQGWTDVADPSYGTVFSVPNAVSAVPGAVANPQPPAPPPQSAVPGTAPKPEPIAQSKTTAPPAAAGSPSKTKFCQECGKPIPRSSKFCSECGNAQG